MTWWHRWRRDYEWCWACEDYVGWRENCSECEAPPWGGYIYPGLRPSSGVYVIGSDIGLIKIGVSSEMTARFASLRTEARRRGVALTALACLPGAGYEVEKWLHKALAETRDPKWAAYESLPNHTEWFWPTPAINVLVRGGWLTPRTLTPELARFDLPLKPWERSVA